MYFGPFNSYTKKCIVHAILPLSTTVNVLVLVVLIFSQNFSTNGPYVVLNFCKVFDTIMLLFAKKSYTAGKFTGETEKSPSEEVTEVSMKSTKFF